MKSLTEYINEEKLPLFTEMVNFVKEAIDFLYNEGVVDYNDDMLVKYVGGTADIPYADIANVLLSDYKNMSAELVRSLKDISRKGVKKDSPEDNAIRAAIEEYVSENNIK